MNSQGWIDFPEYVFTVKTIDYWCLTNLNVILLVLDNQIQFNCEGYFMLPLNEMVEINKKYKKFKESDFLINCTYK
jgi:hypothetical protein